MIVLDRFLMQTEVRSQNERECLAELVPREMFIGLYYYRWLFLDQVYGLKRKRRVKSKAPLSSFFWSPVPLL